MVVNKIKNYFLKDKKEFLAISFVVILSLFLRLYRIADYMTFLGDEGRDALVWLRMSRGKFTLIGPQTSVGNMYLGPLYYYLMFPFYLLFGTIGPSIGTALFSGATTFLLWRVGREWFSNRAGIVAAFLYAISPVAIELSRSAWNPNIMPFFALLIIWGVWQFWQKKNYFWLLAEGVFLSFAVQSHYLGLLLFPVVGFFWLARLRVIIKTRESLKTFLLATFGMGAAFIFLTFLPLIWFDLRHNFINYHAFYKFFSERQTTVNFKIYKAIPNLWPLWRMFVERLLAGKNFSAGSWTSVMLVISTLEIGGLMLLKKSQEKSFFKKGMWLVLLWLLIGLTGMGLYKQHIYDHYFGFLFPAGFLLVAGVFDFFWVRYRTIALFFVLFLLFFSTKNFPLKYPPASQMKKTAEIAKKIAEESGGESFNLGLIAKQNYDAGYRYFLEKWNKKPVEINPQHTETITDQLFVICEEECQPTTSPQAEIAFFGWSKIEKEWNFPWGVKLYKLVHYEKK